MSDKWRIEQLSELVREALRTIAYGGQESGRVRDVPDVRSIRYYTTLGLLDRPLEMQGRTAYYGPRHVLQLVAIKRFQATGMSLVEVQNTLAGAGDQELGRLADLPPAFFANATAGAKEAKHRSTDERSESAARRRYWAQAPDLAADRPTTDQAAPGPRPAVILPIAEGVSLVIEGAGADVLDEGGIRLLQPALAGLRDALIRAGIAGDTADCAASPRKEKPL